MKTQKNIFTYFSLLPVCTLLLCVLANTGFAAEQGFVEKILAAAKAQVGVTTSYDSQYRRLEYPGGDVPMNTGVCTDVVIRAFRAASVDLQVLVHEDMRAAFDEYPTLWGLNRPDRNIDHRRVPNLARFFERHGAKLSISQNPADYLSGDIVTWRLASGVPHIGIVSDSHDGVHPLVVHNIGAGAQEEDVLFAYEITGHYRYRP